MAGRSDNPPQDRLARALVRPFFAIVHHAQWSGIENVPAHGPAILAANHQSFYDPMLIGAPLSRRVVYLAWERYVNMPLLGPLMRWVGTVPVDVNAPTPRSLARLLKALEAGRVCGIFPEGSRTRDGLIAEPLPGVAMLALRSGAPIIPVTVSGAYRAWPRRRALPVTAPVSLHFGRPFHPQGAGKRARADKARRRALTYEVMLRIADGFACLGRPELAEQSRRRLVSCATTDDA